MYVIKYFKAEAHNGRMTVFYKDVLIIEQLRAKGGG
jgi:hypothetical protein